MEKVFMKFLRFSILVVWVSLSACGEDFLPESLLSESRILAVVAEPIEPGLEDSVSLTPVLHLPEGATLLSETWTFCPITLGSNFGFQCVVEECETVVTAAETVFGSVSESPGARLIDCAFNHLVGDGTKGKTSEEEGSLEENKDAFPPMVETVFRYRAVIEETLADGSVKEVTRKSLTRIKLHHEEPPENQNPAIESIEVDEITLNLEESETGIVLSGATEKLEVCDQEGCSEKPRQFPFKIKVLELSLDSYFNEIDDTEKTEEPKMKFYVTAGRFDAEDSGLVVEGNWSFKALTEEQEQSLLAGSLEVSLYVVVRDGKGGMGSYGPFKFTVEP